MADPVPTEALQQAADAAKQAAAAAQDAAASLAEQSDALGYAAAATTGVDPFVFRLAIFVMAIFVGYYVVWSVTPALHTPLMSVTNAISSVIVVGALVAAGASAADGATWISNAFGFIGAALAAVNIVGGFMVTSRMLAMYKKKQ
ncbi:MAG: NAD(P) transhydrogenase subunit alpha [Rhodobacteraceae bacterium]|nr:NAD(P) transhydrogenase subunit alpha [Paracoccaceae bacterium]